MAIFGNIKSKNAKKQHFYWGCKGILVGLGKKSSLFLPSENKVI